MIKTDGFRPFCLEVWGEYACFTRPEMKVERVSYDVPTPSSVRAVFEAIFWKPAIRWRVSKIEVLNPIKWVSVRRNEIGAIMSDRTDGLFIEANRQQRAGLFLKDVRYRFHAMLEYVPIEERRKIQYRTIPESLWDSAESDFQREEIEAFNAAQDSASQDETPGKYLAMFERRARKGQCFNQPYLGCREFSCHFRLVDDPSAEPDPIDESRHLGFMLYDMDYSDIDDPKPMFFPAELKNGVVHIPPIESQEIRR